MKSLLIYWVLAGAVMMAPITALGQPQDAPPLFDAAQAQFEEAMERHRRRADDLDTRQTFYEAASAFADIYEQGVRSANVCVNAGNGFYFAGDQARALLWYLRAEQLANRPKIRSGVAALRRLCNAQRWPAEQGSIGRVLMFWHYDLKRATKQLWLLLLFPPGAVLIAISLYVTRRRVLRRVGMALMIVGGTLGVSDLVATAWPEPPAAVILSDTVGRTGNGRGYSVNIPRLPAGQEIKLLEHRNDWLHVKLPDQSTCWIPATTAEKV
jgi:hypothetical protein